MIIIGLTGTLGSGKGAMVEHLVQTHHFVHLSVRVYLTEELKHLGKPPNRDELFLLANELRATHSPAFIVEELYRHAQTKTTNCVIESIRTPGEVEALRRAGHFYLIAIDAPQPLRYERIKLRGLETDHVTFEKFQADEAREMSSTDPHKQNIGRCVTMADFTIHNTGTIEEFHQRIDALLASIMTKEEKV